MLNWIVWTVYLYKMDLELNNYKAWYAIKIQQTNKNNCEALSKGLARYTNKGVRD